MKKLHVSCALLALLAGCAEESGDPGPGTVRDQQQCRPNGITIDIDQVLPVGFSARQLIESLPEEARVPGAVWPAQAVADREHSGSWGAPPDAGTNVTLRPRVRDLEEIELFDGFCAWQGEFALAGTLEILAEDGSIGRTVHGHFSGEPGRVVFNEPRSPVVRSHLCSAGAQVAFIDDALPAGVLCDGAGNVLAFPSTCSGGPSLAGGWPQGPAPREEIERLGAHGPLAVVWQDGSRSELTLELELEPDSVCYGVHVWTAQVHVRATAASVGLAIDEQVELRVGELTEEPLTVARGLGAACESVEEDNTTLRTVAGLGAAPGALCLSIVENEAGDFAPVIEWIGGEDEDAGVDGAMQWVVEEADR